MIKVPVVPPVDKYNNEIPATVTLVATVIDNNISLAGKWSRQAHIPGPEINSLLSIIIVAAGTWETLPHDNRIYTVFTYEYVYGCKLLILLDRFKINTDSRVNWATVIVVKNEKQPPGCFLMIETCY